MPTWPLLSSAVDMVGGRVVLYLRTGVCDRGGYACDVKVKAGWATEEEIPKSSKWIVERTRWTETDGVDGAGGAVKGSRSTHRRGADGTNQQDREVRKSG